MNGLSVAGMAIGATIAMPEMLRFGYDKRMVSGIIQGGSSLGIMMPPSVVMVLYGMIARQPVSKLWMAGIIPALMFAAMLIAYIIIRCRINPSLAPRLSKEDLANITPQEKRRLLLNGLLPLAIILSVTGAFLAGFTSLVESSAVGAFVEEAHRAGSARGSRPDPQRQLHVHVDHDGCPLLQRCFRRSRRRARHQAPLPRFLEPVPLGRAYRHADFLPLHGHVPR